MEGEQYYMTKMIDLTGQRFGRLTVVRRAENTKRGQAAWLCRCECGGECVVPSVNLRRGKTRSCGCLHRELQKRPVANLVGRKFGRLAVLEYAGSSSWRCRCDCGNECIVATGHLTDGHTQSCGCLQREATSESNWIDLTGRRFGHLVVLERYGADRNVQYRCKCDCGNECIKYGRQLTTERALSCGCMTQSNGEYHIEQYLMSNGFSFDKQVRFGNLVGTGGGNLLFDFAVNHPAYGRVLIEYQGTQHYFPGGFHASQEHFEHQQENDSRKRIAADLLGYPLVEVRYTKRTYESVARYLNETFLPLLDIPVSEWEFVVQKDEEAA